MDIVLLDTGTGETTNISNGIDSVIKDKDKVYLD
jgi:hypothetical protein